MTTPAGWYDDGSGRQRWWDGEQWTEHFAPDVESVDEVSTDAESSTNDAPAAPEEASVSDAAWTEAAPTDAAPSAETPAEDASAAPAPEAVPAEPSTEAPAAAEVPASPWSAESAAESPETSDPTPPALPSEPAPQDWSTPPTPPALQDWSTPPPLPSPESDVPPAPTAFDQGVPAFSPPGVPNPATPGFAAPAGYPGTAAAPAYAPVAPSYAPAAPSFGSGGPGYPGAGAGAYPMAGYGAAPEGPAPLSVLGLIGAGAAALGLIFAFIPVLWVFSWILLGGGLIVSLISLFRAGRKWPGITGMIVAVLGFILAVVMGVVFFIVGVASTIESFPTSPSGTGTETDDPSTTPVDPDEIEGAVMTPVIDLALGDCLPYVDSGDEASYEVPVVPCDVAHAEEVYLVYDIAADEYPGEDAVIAEAEERCVAEFETFVGIPYMDSELDYYYYYPTSSTWTSQNDRAITCIVYSYDDVTGTLQGAAR